MNNLRAVIYARYSSSNQHEESIEGQVRECRAAAERDGCFIVNIYADRALTGTNDKRPEFLKMINDSAKNKFDVVYIYKTDRFARNRYDSAIYKKKLHSNNVQIRYAKEIIPDTPEGVILESTLEGFAEYFSKNLAVNVQRGKVESAMKGVFQGSRPPLGYIKKNGFLEINTETEPLVKRIFSMYVNGTNIIEIVSILYKENIKTPLNKNFTRLNIKRILTNEVYTGTLISGKFARAEREIIRTENAVPIIIDKETFNFVQEKLAMKKQRPRFGTGKVQYPLSQKIKCGLCGRTIVLKQHSNEKYKYLVCSGRVNKMCDKTRLNYHTLTDKILHIIKNEILSEDGIKSIAELTAKQQEPQVDYEYDVIKTELEKTQKSIQNIMSAIEAGIFTPTTASRLKELEEKQNVLSNKLAEKKEVKTEKLSAEQIEFFLYKYVTDLESIPNYDDTVLKTFVSSVVVFDDYAEVVLNVFNTTYIEKRIEL